MTARAFLDDDDARSGKMVAKPEYLMATDSHGSRPYLQSLLSQAVAGRELVGDT